MSTTITQAIFPSMPHIGRGLDLRGMFKATIIRLIQLFVVLAFFIGLAGIAVLGNHHTSAGFSFGVLLALIGTFFIVRWMRRSTLQKNRSFRQAMPPFSEVYSLQRTIEASLASGSEKIRSLGEDLVKLASRSTAIETNDEAAHLLAIAESVSLTVVDCRGRSSFERYLPLLAEIDYWVMEISGKILSVRAKLRSSADYEEVSI